MEQHRIFILFLLLNIGTPLLIMAQNDLSPYRWENRLILLFFPTDADKELETLQKEINKERAELEDRDLLICQLVEKGKSHIGDQVLAPASVQALRKKYRVQEKEATLILIGKDGGEKRRQIGSEIDLKALFPLIDGMPMRRQEMREKKNG